MNRHNKMCQINAMKMKNLLLTLITLAVTHGYAQPSDTLYGTYTHDRHLCADTVYIVKEAVFIDSGYTLSIDPGTVIKGTAGSGELASYIVISRGAKIVAEGTPAQPIIFTTVLDEITNIHPNYPGFANLTMSDYGLWGGLIVLGNAQISALIGIEDRIPGIPISNPNGFYGGSDNEDNSGIMQYISLRHCGIHIGEGNEINALTLAAIGSNTIIDHIETIMSLDDGIEVMGGTVNLNDILTAVSDDDGIDVMQGYSGTIDNFIIYGTHDASMELDGPEAADLGLGNYKLKNGTVYIDGFVGELCDTDDNTNVDMDSVFWFGLELGCYDLGARFTELPTVTEEEPVFSNFQATIPDGDAITDYFLSGADEPVTDVDLGSQTVGANICEFTSWTAAEIVGLFTTDFVINPVGCNDPTSSNYCPYALTATNCRYDVPFGCVNSASVQEERIESLSFKVYPNPSNEKFTLEISAADVLNLNYIIYDMLGKKVSEGQLLETTQTIDASNWESGIYVLTVAKNDTFFTTRMVKN